MERSSRQSRQRRTNADIARCVREVREVFGHSQRPQKCPFAYEIRDGHLIIEGEDFGNAVEAFALGEKLCAFTRILYEISKTEIAKA